jgi:hypothetical protein
MTSIENEDSAVTSDFFSRKRTQRTQRGRGNETGGEMEGRSMGEIFAAPFLHSLRSFAAISLQQRELWLLRGHVSLHQSVVAAGFEHRKEKPRPEEPDGVSQTTSSNKLIAEESGGRIPCLRF